MEARLPTRMVLTQLRLMSSIISGKITSVVYNPIGEEGGDKITASKNGEYVMTDNGPLWHEQSEAFGKYVVDNQGVDKLVLNDEKETRG